MTDTRTTPGTSDAVTSSIEFYDANVAQHIETYGAISMDSQLDTFGGLLASGRVLDAGCGTGRDLTSLQARGYQAVGIDLTPGFVQHVAGLGLPVLIGDLRNLPCADGTFDGIWACASLVHFDDQAGRDVLGELRRVTRTGGALYVSVKAGNGAGALSSIEGDPRWFYRWAPEQFAAAAGSSGFDVTSVTRPSPEWIDVFATAR